MAHLKKIFRTSIFKNIIKNFGANKNNTWGGRSSPKKKKIVYKDRGSVYNKELIVKLIIIIILIYKAYLNSLWMKSN